VPIILQTLQIRLPFLLRPSPQNAHFIFDEIDQQFHIKCRSSTRKADGSASVRLASCLQKFLKSRISGNFARGAETRAIIVPPGEARLYLSGKPTSAK
jgi:hypothetical protein